VGRGSLTLLDRVTFPPCGAILRSGRVSLGNQNPRLPSQPRETHLSAQPWASAILQPGFWKMCRDGMATPSTQGLRGAPSRPHRIPVAWVCVMGWVARDGTVNFRDDVYKHDETHDRDALADVAAGGFVARYAFHFFSSSDVPSLRISG
jgi:hypothetical protein